MDIVMLVIRLALAAVFAIAAVAKLLDLPKSRQTMRDFGVPEPLAEPAGVAVPLAELAVALLLIPVATATGGAILALLLLLAFIGAIGANLARGNRPQCNCFGQIHSEPIGWPTLARNGVLAALALVAAVSGLAGTPGASLLGWTGALGVAGWLTLVGFAAVAVATAAAIWLLVHLVGQNGRLLERVDRIEAALADADIALATDEAADDDEDEADDDETLGVGDPAPTFELAGLHGETMTLDALRANGKPVLLVFSSPDCVACNALLPDLGAWQRDHADTFTTAIVSRGPIGANRGKAAEHGLTNFLLQEGNEVAEEYGIDATPTGVVIRPDGALGSLLIEGVEAIRGWAGSLIQGKVPLTDAPEPERPTALPIGTPAPALEFAALTGRNARLDQLGKQPTVLLFFDPRRNLSLDMVLDLKALEARPRPGAPKLVIVSAGDIALVRSLGLRSRILLDPNLEAAIAFGLVGTPAAILLDAAGRVASAPAYGARAILALANGEDPANAPADGANRIGLVAPAFDLPTLDGERMRLADLKGRPALLLFWNPTCGYCAQMLDDLRKWQANPPEGAPRLAIVSRGDAEAIRAQNLPSPVLLDPDRAVSNAYRAYGTPNSVLVDAEGRIASPIAVGAPEFFTLANGGDLSTIGAAANGAAPKAIEIGKAAPAVRLPNLAGEATELASFHGERTLVLFWNPTCGYCQRMRPDLLAWEQNPPPGAPKLFVVSTGDAAANEAQGFRSTVVLDPFFATATAFGATGTPSAVLVDAEGRVASDVAVGGPNVLALANSVEPAVR